MTKKYAYDYYASSLTKVRAMSATRLLLGVALLGILSLRNFVPTPACMKDPAIASDSVGLCGKTQKRGLTVPGD